jgi:hypothetical protein
MSDIRTILSTIQSSIDQFTGDVGAKQETLFRQIVTLAKDLDVKDDAIVNSVANLKKISQIKIKIEKLIIDPKYKDQLKQFVQSYDAIQQLHNDYFANINAAFTPFAGLNILKKTAVQATLNNLTEAGIDANVTGPLKKILMANMAAGGSYADLTDQLRTFMLGKDKIPGALQQYVGTYATTSINQFSAEYNKMIADDLGMEWYVYTGSLLTTSRPFCIKAVNKKYIHISEFQALLDGDFGSLGKVHMNKKTGLPDGMMDGTNPENFPRRRGGWNCGHQLIAVNEIIVPQNLKDAVYRTAAYKSWAARNGKTPKEPSALQTNFYDQLYSKIQKNFSDDELQNAEDQTGLSYNEIVNLTGGIPGNHITNIKHQLEVNDYKVESTISTDQYHISRYIYDDGHIYNAYMRVNDGGKGTGLNLFANQVIEARNQNLKYLEVSAEGNYSRIEDWNGYITLAKFGYSMDNYSQSRFNSLMDNAGRTEKTVFELVSTPEGLDYWTKNGFSWHGYFYLNDESAELANFRNYLSSRNLEINL